MNFISKSVSHPSVISGFAAILATVAFLAALALAAPSNDDAFGSAQVTPVGQPALDPAGLALAMSLETSPADSDDDPMQVPFTSGLEHTPEQQQVACSWEASATAPTCLGDWPYEDAPVTQAKAEKCYSDFGDVVQCPSDQPDQHTQVAQVATDEELVCGEEINDLDSLKCLDN
jgi:hypothetical protein